MFPLFQAAYGRYSHNWTQYKESIVPEYWPGGGGWSIFCFSLNNIFVENQKLLNWWSKSNKGLNLCRYIGLKCKFFRQQCTDYVVSYSTEPPFEVGKFHYPSSHPQRLLTYNHHIIVPSHRTQPNYKKAYITKFIKPPKEYIDKWYFQQHFGRHFLVMFTTAACSLNSFFISQGAESNNVSLWSINTKLIKKKAYQYTGYATTGFSIGDGNYLYATHAEFQDIKNLTAKDVILLGNPMPYYEGEPRGSSQISSYDKSKWGNFWHPYYLNNEYTVLLSNLQYTNLLATPEKKMETGVTILTTGIVTKCRYNPNKDTGEGNEAYWVSNIQEEQGWDTQVDPDLIIRGFPLWILLWGWEDWQRKLSKIHSLDHDYILVVKSDFIEPKLPAYIFLNNNFVEGHGRYGQPKAEIDPYQLKHWYPKFYYQQEAIEELLMCGPAVPRSDCSKTIQAHMLYKFYFKWGGNPSTMETVADPASQPTYPLPSGQFQNNEINDPSTDIKDLLYTFDVRRHLITQKAKKRIFEKPTYDSNLFTDGTDSTKQALFDPPTKKQKVQETSDSSTEEEEQTPLQNQLQQLRHHNQQLLQRYRQLKQLLTDLP